MSEEKTITDGVRMLHFREEKYESSWYSVAQRWLGTKTLRIEVGVYTALHLAGLNTHLLLLLLSLSCTVFHQLISYPFQIRFFLFIHDKCSSPVLRTIFP